MFRDCQPQQHNLQQSISPWQCCPQVNFPAKTTSNTPPHRSRLRVCLVVLHTIASNRKPLIELRDKHILLNNIQGQAYHATSCSSPTTLPWLNKKTSPNIFTIARRHVGAGLIRTDFCTGKSYAPSILCCRYTDKVPWLVIEAAKLEIHIELVTAQLNL